jgi:hypothetical protein
VTTRPFITIRRHITESGKRSYRWDCHRCDVYGIHRFDRWTDYVKSRHGHPDIHPWRRCIDAVDRHACHAHRGLIAARAPGTIVEAP